MSRTERSEEKSGLVTCIYFILLCLLPVNSSGRTKQPSDPAPPLTKPLYFQEVCILSQDHHLHLYCERKQTRLTEENEAGLSQRAMDRVWCCDLGKMWGRAAEPPEGASWELGDLWKWWTNQYLILRYVLGSRTLGHNRYFNLWEDSLCWDISQKSKKQPRDDFTHIWCLGGWGQLGLSTGTSIYIGLPSMAVSV